MVERTRKIKEFFIKEFCIFKTATLVLGMLLLVSDINLFFVEKPNISVVKYIEQTTQNFPLILLCLILLEKKPSNQGGISNDPSFRHIKRKLCVPILI